MHTASALNPLASAAEVKAIAAAAFSRGASSAQIRAEIEALQKAKQRTAELQELKQKRELHPHRRDLKAQRAELKELLGKVQTELTTVSQPPPPAPVVGRRKPPQQRSQVQELLQPTLQLKAPVLDPTESVPASMVDRFREEYREMQRKAAAERQASAAAAELRLPPIAGGEDPHTQYADRQTLEDWRTMRGHALKAPVTPPDLKQRTHGSQRRAVFAQFGGAQSLSEEGASPSGKRRIAAPMRN